MGIASFITCRTFSVVPYFLHCSWHFQSFFFFSLHSFRVRVLGSRHREGAWRRRACQQVLAGRAGVARSSVAVFVARRCLCLETRGKHEWALFGLHCL